jgi:hypothetical protein
MAEAMTPAGSQRRFGWVFLLLLLVTLAARAQTFGNPVIEYDEQFYLVVGARMLDGARPYIDIWDRKPIGLFLLFAGMRWVGGLFGGDGVLAVQLIAALFVAATAQCVNMLAERCGARRFASLCAGIGYILWLNLLQGEGGQASVFYALPMVLAALIVFDVALERRWTTKRPLFAGLLAMALAGLAIQLKYTVVFEGGLFGLWLLWALRKRGYGWIKLAGTALLLAGVALLPTVLVAGVYAAWGQLDAFLFANFWSGLSRGPVPTGATLKHLATDIGIVSLPMAAAYFGLHQMEPRSSVKRFLLSWLFVSAAAILIIGTFSPHYFIPLLLPLMIAAAPLFELRRKGAIALLIASALAGQGLIAYLTWQKGGRAEAEAMVRAIGPVPHCLYVHDGYPILYHLTGSCLPSKFIFPGHLNTATEAPAIGVDGLAEVKRILATKPDAIVTDLPAFSQGNRITAALVNAELTRHYALKLKLRTGQARFRLVYRRVDAGDH